MPNIFSDVYAGGTLMDLGSTASTWPLASLENRSSATTPAQQLPNSVDLYGQGVLIYPEFQVAIQAGKNITSHLPAEIYTKTGTLTLNAVAAINQARFVSHSGKLSTFRSSPARTKCKKRRKPLPCHRSSKPAAYLEWLQTAEQVHETLYHMRQSAGIQFKDEKNERTISTNLERPVRNTRI